MTRHIALLLPVIACLSVCSQNEAAREQPAQEQPVREEKAVKAIEALGGRVERDETLPGRPVVSVDLDGTKVTDSDLKVLRELKDLQTLDLSRTQITDAGLKELKELKGRHIVVRVGDGAEFYRIPSPRRDGSPRPCAANIDLRAPEC